MGEIKTNRLCRSGQALVHEMAEGDAAGADDDQRNDSKHSEILLFIRIYICKVLIVRDSGAPSRGGCPRLFLLAV